jgi:hypothetical protein
MNQEMNKKNQEKIQTKMELLALYTDIRTPGARRHARR